MDIKEKMSDYKADNELKEEARCKSYSRALGEMYAPYVELKENKGGNWYYNVTGHNKQILSTSEAYSKKSNAHRAACTFISTVRKHGIYLK